MGIYKRGNGYLVDFTFKKERKQGQFATREEAERWEFETLAALKAGKPVPEPEQPKVVGGATIGAALRDAKDKHWSTLRGSTRAVLNADLFVKWVGENTPAREALTDDKVHEFVKYLTDERKVADGTINRYLSAISVITRYAKVTRPELKFRKTKQVRKRFFTEDEVASSVSASTGWRGRGSTLASGR
jgi:hypothetical protein